MSGHGLPVMKKTKNGDLYVKIQIEMPKKLTVEQKKIIQQLADNGM
jgi:curved DNA-binding protein